MRQKDAVDIIRKTLNNVYSENASQHNADLEMAQRIYRNLNNHDFLNPKFDPAQQSNT